ncbi:hypothetical protein FDECE_305 [Fusarium decemcellulare]|nr:hypothetical protein FDECE_305 [Fusarium decemcellulare]
MPNLPVTFNPLPTIAETGRLAQSASSSAPPRCKGRLRARRRARSSNMDLNFNSLPDKDKFIVKRKILGEAWLQIKQGYEAKWGPRTLDGLRSRFARLKNHPEIGKLFDGDNNCGKGR